MAEFTPSKVEGAGKRQRFGAAAAAHHLISGTQGVSLSDMEGIEIAFDDPEIARIMKETPLGEMRETLKRCGFRTVPEGQAAQWPDQWDERTVRYNYEALLANHKYPNLG